MGDWVVVKRRSRFTVGWYVSYVWGLISQTFPEPALIDYTFRHKTTGATVTFDMPGDHTAAQLFERIAVEQARQSA
jgi:hypothetical protein